MFNPNEIEAFSMLLDKPMKALEMRIMEDIVRRIKINGEITRSADWQITRLLQLGMSMKEIENDIQTALNFSDEDMREMYSNIIGSGYARDKKLYEAVGAEFIPFEQNNGLQQLVSAVAAQTNGTLKNITQSLGFAVRQPDGKLQFIKLADYYQKTLDNAMLDIASGAFDYNTVLKRTVKEMTDSGLRTVDYATGWKNRVDVAARRAIMTGMSQLTAKVNEDNAQQLATDWFEVTWHSGARPEHQFWQGKWYTRKQLETVCGLGMVTGLCGANCYHDYYPVIPGISEPTYTDEELAELNAKDNAPIEYNGRKYTKYEALQRQRRLETTMRAQRQEIKLLKDGGASEDDLINARARYRGTSHEYAVFSQAMGLPQQRDRVTIDGLGNIGHGRYTGGSGKESPVQVPPVGAKVTDKVSDQERRELLSRDKVDIHNSSIDKSGENDIIKIDKKLYPDTLVGVERGEPMTFEDADSGNVNPNYGKKGYDTNCQTCTIVNEARRRGYDVEALPNTPNSMSEKLARQYTFAWIDPKTGKRPEFIKDNSKDSPKKYLGFMKNTVKPGERYVIGFTWKGKGNSGHIVNLDLTENGELRIKDNQRGSKERSEWIGDKAVLKYLKGMKWSETLSGYKMPKVPKMLRIDNLQFEPDVAKKIMKRRDK